MFFTERNAPRWFILLSDLGICLVSFVVSYLLRFDFNIRENEFEYLWLTSGILVFVRGVSFLLGRSYQGIIRYTESKDIQRIFVILSLGSAFLIILNFIGVYTDVNFNIPRAVILIDFVVTFFLMVLFRLTIKDLYNQLQNDSKDKRDVIIYGSDSLAQMTKLALERDAGTKYRVLAFIDPIGHRVGKKIEGINIVSDKELKSLLEKNEVHHVILSVQNLKKEKKQEIIDLALDHDSRVFDVPPADSWIKGELSFKQIKKVKIEDLLGREPIVIDNMAIGEQIKDKVVLVTGGAGSIGSELVKQIARYTPQKLIVLDQAESPLYEIELAVRSAYPYLPVEIVIADVTDSTRMSEVFSKYQPNIVYHAAAYKHVPMMELNPTEAARVNVIGTKTVADYSVKYKVEKMVFVSTDKAVNPTNVMGASKRVAEIYVQSLNNTVNTNFVTTRFGNVLGSNGSVIPRFREQIEEGGPITVTHPDVTRFFMTIPEACQLILEAGCMSKGGEIFVFDMGESVKIVDLAKKMIKLSRLEIDKDIEIVYTGLRPGEKLYEELLNNKENTLPTHHSKILIGKVRQYEFDQVRKEINELIEAYKSFDEKGIVKKMKEIVPEFKSKNSPFEALDVVKE